MAAPWCQWRWGAPKWPPTPQTLGAPRRSRDAPRMAASWCQWQNGAPPWPRLDASAVSVKDARRAAPWSAAASDRRRGSTVRSARGTACASRRCSGAGLVLVDTGNYRARDKTFAAVRGWDGAPLAAAVYTHGHVDHACGLPPFLEEARTRSWPRPRIVGHRDVARRFDRYRATAPWNGLINARQFSIAPSWPTAYDYPDTTYADTHRLEIGGVALELTHARGETDDHPWLWWPARRMLFPGGVGALVARATALAASGDLALASHLADWAVAAAPDDRAAHAARAAIYEARAEASAALMTRGIFAAVARESAEKARGR